MPQRLLTWAAPMWRMLLCSALLAGSNLHADPHTLRIGGTGSALGTVRLLGDAAAMGNAVAARLDIVPNLGSSGALRALQAGAIDIALITRPLTPVESATGLVAYEYGRSPFVFVTNKAGVQNLTSQAIADFFSGRTPTWPDGQPVRVVLRPSTDINNVYLAAFSPDIAVALSVAHKRPGMVVASTDQDAADQAERLPGSLAATTLSLLLSEGRKLNVIAVDGAAPSSNALANDSIRYPHVKPMLIVTRGTPNGAAAQLIEFVKSPQGRAILQAHGHFVSP